jgi:hypothetical protein
MRGTDTYTESLFTMRRFDDFVPESHPLRPVRTMVNKALKNIVPLLPGMRSPRERPKMKQTANFSKLRKLRSEPEKTIHRRRSISTAC